MEHFSPICRSLNKIVIRMDSSKAGDSLKRSLPLWSPTGHTPTSKSARADQHEPAAPPASPRARKSLFEPLRARWSEEEDMALLKIISSEKERWPRDAGGLAVWIDAAAKLTAETGFPRTGIARTSMGHTIVIP